MRLDFALTFALLRQPTYLHKWLRHLDDQRLLAGVVTTNVDGLERQAGAQWQIPCAQLAVSGLADEAVCYLHGGFNEFRCWKHGFLSKSAVLGARCFMIHRHNSRLAC